ncbi:MAG: Spy/CpxP family protein refolding chaperone [Hyphomicrobiaceae bacterium]
MNGNRIARALLLVAATSLGAQVASLQPSMAQSRDMGPGMMGPGGSGMTGPGMYPGMGPGMMGGMYPGMGPGMMGGMYPGMGPGMMGGMYPGMGPGMMGGMYPGMGPGMMGGTYPGMGPGMMGGMYPGMGPGMMGGMYPGMGYGLDARYENVRLQLGITDAQKTVWEGYVKAVKARWDAMQGMHQAMLEAWQKGTPATRLDARINGMEAMLQNLKAQKPALEALYKALSDDQKKKANYLLGMGWGMM